MEVPVHFHLLFVLHTHPYLDFVGIGYPCTEWAFSTVNHLMVKCFVNNAGK